MRRLLFLQATRAVAASIVVIDHSIGICVASHVLSPSYLSLAWAMGHLGVDVFFVISGFIMVRTAQGKYGSLGGASVFAWDRITRIVPVYWIALLIAAFLAARHTDVPAEQIVKSLLFIPYWNHAVNLMRPVLQLGWTLNYEMFFYLLFTGAVLFQRSLAISVLTICLVALVAIGMTFHTLVPYMEPATVVQFWTDPIILFFSLGAVMGYFEDRLTSLISLPPHPLFAIEVLMALTLAASVMLKLTFPMPLIWQAFYAVIAAICVLLCIGQHDLQPSRLMRFLVARGDDSYCTYLFQFLIVAADGVLILRLGNRVWVPPFVITASVLGANLLGWAANIYLVRPMTKALRRRRAPGAELDRQRDRATYSQTDNTEAVLDQQKCVN